MHPGEKLRLIITGHNLIGATMPSVPGPKGDNHGHHIIHTGASHDSQLVLPIK
jgi:predicted acyl esterase